MFGILKSKKEDPVDVPLIEGTRESVPYGKFTVVSHDSETNIFYCSDGAEFYLGACFVGETLNGADGTTVEKFRSGLGMLFPVGTFVQIGLLSSPDVMSILDRYLAKKSNADGINGEICRQHYDFVTSGVDRPLVARSGVLLNRQRQIITIKIPCPRARPNASDIASTKEYADRLSEALKSAGLNNLQMLDARQFLQITRLMTNLWEPADTSYDEYVPIREQVFFAGDEVSFDDPSTISFHGGKYFSKVLSVKNFPKRTNLGVMNFMVGDPQGLANQITEPYYMVLTIHYPDQTKKSDWVRSRSAMINHQVFGPTAHLIPMLGYKKQGIDTLVHEMEGKGAVLCDVNFTVFLFSRDRERLNKLSSGLQAYYSSLAFEMREDRRVLEPLWNNLLPLNTTREGIMNLFRFRTMAIAHAVQFLPVIGEWKGSGLSGTTLLLTRHGQPALFDLYESSTNFNGVMFAESGGGKSFLTQRIVCDYLAEGAKIWVIDAGKSYYKLCRAVQGEFIEFNPSSQICLNPFTFVDGNLEEEMDVLKAMIAKMAAPEEVLDDYRMSLLEQAITSVYKHYGNSATVTAVAEWCIAQPDLEAQRLGKQLYPFAGGSYTRWFDGENNLNLDNAFVVCELQDLKGRKALQQVVLLQLISRINHEIFLTHGKGQKRILIVDEAWELLDDPVMGKAMEAVYRKARKHEGAVLVVTQSVSDLYNSPNARAIYENSAWQFILQQKAEAIDSAIEGGRFKIEPYGAHMLKTVHTVKGKNAYSEVMVKRTENDWGILRLSVNRFTQVMFSTSGSERDDILSELDAGGNAVQAVNNYISREQALKSAAYA